MCQVRSSSCASKCEGIVWPDDDVTESCWRQRCGVGASRGMMSPLSHAFNDAIKSCWRWCCWVDVSHLSSGCHRLSGCCRRSSGCHPRSLGCRCRPSGINRRPQRCYRSSGCSRRPSMCCRQLSRCSCRPSECCRQLPMCHRRLSGCRWSCSAEAEKALAMRCVDRGGHWSRCMDVHACPTMASTIMVYDNKLI
jgi:hypothetical protein